MISNTKKILQNFKIIESEFYNISCTKKDETYLSLLIKNLDYIDNVYDYKMFLKENCDEVIKTLKNSRNKVLVRGEVQSGKTFNLIYITAKLIKDHGFNFFIFQTGRVNTLNRQNADRFVKIFKNTGIKLECYTHRASNLDSLSVIEKDFNKGCDAVALFGLKNPEKLHELIRKLEMKENLKILFIDDEADDASLTDEYIKGVDTILKSGRASYLQITATPYKTLLKYNNLNYFSYYKALKSPVNYKGINYYSKKNNYHILDIDDNPKDKYLTEALFFKIIIYSFKNKQINSLSHGKILFNLTNSQLKHKGYDSRISYYLENIMSYKEEDFKNVNQTWIYQEGNLSLFKKFVDNLYSNIYIFNSNNHYSLENKDQIIIGGKVISRGITFDNLLSEIIISDNKKFEASDIMQKCRWFGYHKSDVNVFMNKNLFDAYKECSVLESKTNNFSLKNSYKQLLDSENFKLIKVTINKKRSKT